MFKCVTHLHWQHQLVRLQQLKTSFLVYDKNILKCQDEKELWKNCSSSFHFFAVNSIRWFTIDSLFTLIEKKKKNSLLNARELWKTNHYRDNIGPNILVLNFPELKLSLHWKTTQKIIVIVEFYSVLWYLKRFLKTVGS